MLFTPSFETVLLRRVCRCRYGDSGRCTSQGHGHLQVYADDCKAARAAPSAPAARCYVTESAGRALCRVLTRELATFTTVAEGLPPALIGIGGAIDVAFIGSTAYVLVTLVGPDLGGSDVMGIQQVDGPNSFTVIADIGQFALDKSTVDALRRADRAPVFARAVSGRVPRSPMATTIACCG